MTQQQLQPATAVEIARDIMVTVISRSANYDPKALTGTNTRQSMELLTRWYREIIKAVKAER